MAPFNAELYLRVLGEDGLLAGRDGQRGPADAAQVEVARALVAVGAIDAELASTILTGYQLAASLRRGRGTFSVQAGAPTPAGAGSKPESRRNVACDTTVERANMEIRIRSIMLSESETRLSVRIRPLGDVGPNRRSRRLTPRIASIGSYQVADDKGNKSTTSFGGGGSDDEWRGRLTAAQPLAVDTAWIDFEGTRIELVDHADLCEVTIEPLAVTDPARRYVWHWLAAGERHGRQTKLDVVLDALAAAGQPPFEAPELTALRRAHELTQGHMGHAHPGRAIAVTGGAPPEWQSLLAPRPAVRPATGRVALGATPPAFDGITVTVDELTSDEGGWQAEVDVSGIAHGPFNFSLEQPRLAWWAVDDHGQYHLGRLGSYSGNHDGVTGTIEFGSALDRAAETLTLLPTGPTERARIEIPLRWSEL